MQRISAQDHIDHTHTQTHMYSITTSLVHHPEDILYCVRRVSHEVRDQRLMLVTTLNDVRASYSYDLHLCGTGVG